jgi:hypothetical protein
MRGLSSESDGTGAGDLERGRTGQRRAALQELHFPKLRDAAHTGSQLVDDPLLVGAKFIDVNCRLAERDAPVAGVLRFVDDLRHVQKRLRRNASSVETHTAGVLFLVDECNLHTEVCGIESRRISARTCT